MKAARANRWLVFVHQLPAQPSNGRVRIWRRLQQIGAVPVKNSVYVLPNTAQSMEDFEWLRTEVANLGGQANIFAASSVKGIDERHILEQLRAARGKEVVEVKRDSRAPEGRSSQDALDPRDFHGRQWITRSRPGVDRFASAWLIRRFIAADAVFTFGTSPDKRPGAVPFDMYQPGGFKHEGDRCTFEVLLDRFGVKDLAARRMSEIVHDLDLKDDRFKSPHAPTVGLLVEGLRASIAEDEKLLEQGIALFEALYQSLRPGKPLKGGKGRIC